MTIYETYKAATHGPWTTSGLGVQWRIERVGRELRLYFMYTNDGEDGKKDWLHNFMFLPRWTDRGFAHWGISRMFDSVVRVLCASLDALVDSGNFDVLRIAGHSQGAALATAAHDFFSRRYRLLPVVTLATAPPCYWYRFCLFRDVVARADSLTTIYVRGDIVALAMLIAGGRHVGKVIRVGRLSLPRFSKHTFEAYDEALEELSPS